MNSADPGHLYRPRLVDVEARCVPHDLLEEIAGWCGGSVVGVTSAYGVLTTGVSFWTPRGFAVAAPGHWIVRHIQGDFQAWKPSEFRENFEPVYPLEEGSRFRGWFGHNFPDHPQHYDGADMERAFRSGCSAGSHDALCWVQTDAPGHTACDRKRDHKGNHSWDLAGNLTPAERLLRAADSFRDILNSEEISPEIRARIADGAVELAQGSVVALLVAMNEASHG